MLIIMGVKFNKGWGLGLIIMGVKLGLIKLNQRTIRMGSEINYNVIQGKFSMGAT